MRGTDTVLGMKSTSRNYGQEVKAALDTDSVSGRGMSTGCKEGSTRGHTVIVAAGSFPLREATIRQNQR